ncbi:UNVERIFIED_CONTAM: PEX5- protein [Gekko kuhli]
MIVLSTGLDLLDLSEPVSKNQTKAKKSENPSRVEGLKTLTHRKKADNLDLISVDAEQKIQSTRSPEKSSLDLVNIQAQLEKWDEVKFHGDRASKGYPAPERKPSSSRAPSKEFIWSAENRSQSEAAGVKATVESDSASDLELAPAPKWEEEMSSLKCLLAVVGGSRESRWW